jgi:hypothetical protein
MPSTNSGEFLDRAAIAIGKGLKRMGPRLSYEVISVESASKVIALFEALPRYSGELMRKLDALEIGAGIRTNAPLASIKSRVSSFGRKSGKKYRVLAYQNDVYIIRIPTTESNL